jgi:hypothetical protein
VDGKPLVNCEVTVAFYDANGLVAAQSTSTTASGYFKVVLGCAGTASSGARFVISSQCCTNTWTIPTACCCGDVGTLVCQSCGVCSTPPRLTCSSNIVAQCQYQPSPNGGGGTLVTYSTSASGVCDTNITLTCNPPSGSLFPLGTTTVSCSATDGRTNRSSCSFTVKVVDSIPAVLTVSYGQDGNVLLCWPVTCRNYTLQCRPSLSPTVGWTSITDTISTINGRYCLRLPFVRGQNRFYRLVSPGP